jgi:drug/metabolite transporter (DMT)-like permease
MLYWSKSKSSGLFWRTLLEKLQKPRGKGISGLSADAVLIFVTLIWGSTFAVTKSVTAVLGPFSLTFLRFLLAFLTLWVMGLFQKPDEFIKTKEKETNQDKDLGKKPNLLWPAFWLGLLTFGGFALQTMGLERTTVARSGFFTFLFSLFIPPLQALFSKKNLHFASIVGILLALIGVYWFANPEEGGMNLGDWLTLGAALLFAFQIILIDNLEGRSDVLAISRWQFLIAAAVSGAVAFILQEPLGSITWEAAAGLLYLGLAGTALALFLQNEFQRKISPAKATVIYALEPITAALWGLFLLGEGLGLMDFWGAGFILAGVLLAEILPIFFQKKS